MQRSRPAALTFITWRSDWGSYDCAWMRAIEILCLTRSCCDVSDGVAAVCNEA